MDNQSLQVIYQDIIIQIKMKQNENEQQEQQQNSSDQQDQNIYNDNQNSVEVTIYYLNQQKNLRIFQAESKIVGRNRIFSNIQQFSVFLSRKQNYNWIVNQKRLYLFFQVKAFQFQSTRIQIIKFREVRYERKRFLVVFNLILRKQLKYQTQKNNLQMNNYLRNQNMFNNYSQSKMQNQNNKNIQLRHSNSQTPDKLEENLSERRKTKSQNDELNKMKLNKWKGTRNVPVVYHDRQLQGTRKQKKIKKDQYYVARKTAGQYKVVRRMKNHVESDKQTSEQKQKQSSPSIQEEEQEQQQQSQQPQNHQEVQIPPPQIIKREKQTGNMHKYKINIQMPKLIKYDTNKKQYQIQYYNGDRYNGYLLNNKFYGKGTYSSKNFKFQGIWRQGTPNGYGILRCNQGSIEKGNYNSKWKRNGHGQDYYLNGQKYVGNFIDQKKDGYGTYTFKNGDSYHGYWKNDQQHGRGTQYFTNNSKFQGNWMNDVKHGQGTYFSKFGKIKQIHENGVLMKQTFLIDDNK